MPKVSGYRTIDLVLFDQALYINDQTNICHNFEKIRTSASTHEQQGDITT